MKQKQVTVTTATTAAAAAAASSSSFPSRPIRIVQNFLLVWLDAKIDENNEDLQNSLTQLRNIVNTVELFTDVDQCFGYLKSIKDEKIFLIVSGRLGKQTVPLMHDMAQLDTIFVYCGNKDQHEEWAKNWSKVQCVSSSIKSIYKRLKKAAHECDHNKIPMSFVPKQIMIEVASGQQNIDQLEPSYMYSMLFKEIILETDEDDMKPVNDLVFYCRQQQISESQLEYFQRNYRQKSPIWWYTSEIFLYGMFNRALRSLDMEMMIKMGFFIRDLHRQLEQVHKEQSSVYTKKFVVYRGQNFIQQDFDHLVDTKGGLLSFNNFLSTSTKRQVAMEFVERSLHKNKDTVGVLLVMTINPSKASASTTPFALIDEYSAIESDKEILFSMHTVFRVGEIKQMVNNIRLWEVQLILTDDNDPQLAALTHRIHEEVHGTEWDRMGKLMLTVGHLDQAEKLYNELLKNASSDINRTFIYHSLAHVKNEKGEYEEAISFYEKAHAIYQKDLPENQTWLAPTYNNIGLVYNNMGDYSKALEFFEKANKIYEKSLPSNHPHLASSYNNIGQAYDSMGAHSKALECYEKAHKIYKKTLPENHPWLATSYNHIGLLYSHRGDYSKALECYEKALKIREKVLPPNHLDLAQSYNNIGGMYCNMNNYSKAFSFLEKALAIQQKSLPPTHPLIKQSIDNIDYVKKQL